MVRSRPDPYSANQQYHLPVVSFRVDRDTYNLIHRLAREEERSIPVIIKRALKAYMAHQGQAE